MQKDRLFYQKKKFNNFSMSSTEVSLTSKKSKFQEGSLRYFVYVIFIPLVTK